MSKGEKGNALTLTLVGIPVLACVLTHFSDWANVALVTGYAAVCLGSVAFWSRRDARSHREGGVGR